jgi:RNA binding exosome subunit
MKNKKNSPLNKFKPYLAMDLKGFQEILLKSLETYTKNKINISVTLHNLNRYKQLSHAQIENLKQIFKQLRNFVKNSFFKEAINILFVSISKRKSAKVLAEFISDQFRLNQLRTDQMTISRKDNYFLGFLKQTIMLLIKSDTSCLTGVKIVIKGRFNRAPRAKTSSIHFGKFSLQSFNSKIDYHQSTAYTSNGTFGIKVWLCENGY